MRRGDLTGLFQTRCEWRHAGGSLQRVLRRDEPPHFVEVEVPEGQEADMHMPAMGRVERAAQQTDAAMRTAAR